MKSLKEALVHKHMDQKKGFELMNPKLSDLKHLDVIRTNEGYFYVCLEKDKCPIQTKTNLKSWDDDFEAYRLSAYGVILCLGLDNYKEDLICNSGKVFNVVSVYRGLLDGMNYKNFYELWDNLDEKLKDQNIS